MELITVLALTTTSWSAAASSSSLGDHRVTIAPGVHMPLISNGAVTLHTDSSSSDVETLALLRWFDHGGRGIDTAWDYGNQRSVGWALRNTSASVRSSLFVTTKIPCGDGTTQGATKSINEDLSELELSFADLILIHFPCDSHEGTKNVWSALQAAEAAGLARAIGVSNFAKADIDAALSLGGTKPALNQCQMSVGSHDDATIAYCKSNNITYESYSPLRRVDLTDRRITSIATSHNVTAAQTALKWIYQQDVVIATSPGTNPTYAEEDLALASFTLTEEEMHTLAGM